MAHAATPTTTPGEVPQFYVIEDAHADHGEHAQHETGTLLGFWIYLMSDCLIFACLFAVHAVVGFNTAMGPSAAELFSLPLILLSTAMLLFSSITYGFAMIASQNENKRGVLVWLAITGLFGLAFVSISGYEFYHMIHEGALPSTSAFLSSFFTLVGTHALHVIFGIIWLIVLMVQIGQQGLDHANRRKLMCLSMFWHFLDVIWIGVFSFVYLVGVL